MRLTLGWAVAFMSLSATSGIAATTSQEKLVEHGAYVAIAADCQACHTSDKEKPFAGGYTLKTPFGPLVTPNITPDKKTGIGTWTRDDFANALRHGINNQGVPLYPAMPYSSYTKITDADLDALWAYMQTVRPVDNKVVVNRLPFPFDVRASLYAWQALFFKPGRFEPDAAKSEEYNRGAYLVQALEHCGMCHTPRNFMGATISDKALEGAAIQEWYAPDISNGKNSVIRTWSKEQIVSFLQQHSGTNLTPPFGPMAEVVYDSTSKLKTSDVEAIAEYLKTRPVPEEPTVTAAKMPFPRKDIGAEIFQAQCATCHGKEGQGLEGVSAKLAGNEVLTTKRPFNILSVLIEGIETHGVWGEMPSFAGMLSNQEIADVANYVRTAWGNDGLPNVTPSDVRAWRSFASVPSAELDRAMTCPNVPADRLDEQTRAALKTLGMGTINEADVQKIFQQYSERFPDLSTEERFIALMATYCRDAAKALPNRTSVIRQQLEFASALGSAISGDGKQASSNKP